MVNFRPRTPLEKFLCALLALTIEEFLTITVQIEGILNYRPLIPLAAEVENFEVLTPGHFLIGHVLNAIVEPDLCSANTNKLDKYRKITKTVQNIWKSWKKDYLNNLQARSKWQFDQSNVKINTVVLLKEDNLPIAHWIIGKIVQTYPGTDGKIRVQFKLANDNFVKKTYFKNCYFTYCVM
ncbi:integrase catalytic domain-containing protein [Trichonephila clavipes]|nr:integrase catalytic domain-containing protein [Trichonephila clavipes]